MYYEKKDIDKINGFLIFSVKRKKNTFKKLLKFCLENADLCLPNTHVRLSLYDKQRCK